MRIKAPALIPIFRSHGQAQLLATLVLHPLREYTTTELAAQTDMPLSTLNGEIGRLVGAGILRDRRVGRARLVSVDTANRLTRPLTELLSATYGPLTVVPDELANVPGVELVLIYGSWAARYSGEAGPPPNDVDVLVVGAPARTAVYDAAERAQKRLGMPVNAVISSGLRWAVAADALVQQIKASPVVVVIDRQGDAPEAS
jgi:DNA-binding transcriptional ArsR family regulator